MKKEETKKSPPQGVVANEDFEAAIAAAERQHVLVKPVYKGRASVIIYENNDVDVRIPRADESRRANRLKETKHGSLVETSQKDTAQIKLTASVPKDSADPAADLMERVQELLKPIEKKERKLLPRGKLLIDEEGIKVRASTEGVKIYVETPINDALHLQETISNLMIRVTVCLAQQNQYLKRLMIAAQKNSTKS